MKEAVLIAVLASMVAQANPPWTGGAAAAETRRLQDEIDAASAKGGGRVVVTRGVHPCGTLRLKSGVELHLEEGAVLLGGGKSEDYEDFVFSDGFRPEINPPYSHKGFLVAEDAHDVAITGKGTVDASGTQFFDPSTTLWGHWWAKPACARPRLLKMHNCRRVRIEDVTFKDSPTWTIWLRRCEDVTVSRLKVVANDRIINSDGLDIDACRRVRVGDSQFDTGDDCVILRAMCRDGETAVCEDVVVSNCVLRSVCSGVRIGCPSDDLVRNAVFRDIAFEGRNAVVAQNPKRYLRPDCRAGNGGTLRTSGILFENWKAKCSGHPVEIAVEDGVSLSDFGHFTFRNFDVTAKEAIVIRGNAKSPVRDVRLESFRGTIETAEPIDVKAVEGQVIDRFDVSSGNVGKPQGTCDFK